MSKRKKNSIEVYNEQFLAVENWWKNSEGRQDIGNGSTA